MKKKAVAARKIVSMFSRTSRVARSRECNMEIPIGVLSNTLPVISARIESPVRNSKSGQRTLSSPSGWPATL